MSRFAEFEAKLNAPGRPGDFLRTLAELSDHIRTLGLNGLNEGEEGKRLHVLFTETLHWLLSEATPAYLQSKERLSGVPRQPAGAPS